MSCRGFAANAVRLQLHALAYNLGTFLRTLALPEGVERWTLTTLRERLIQIGARVVATAARGHAKRACAERSGALRTKTVGLLY